MSGDDVTPGEGTQQAVVTDGTGEAWAEERVIAEPAPGEALVRVTAIGICGSDVGLIHGEGPPWTDYPIVLGHAITGEVVADFANELKDTFASPLWVTGYATDTGYLPTDRIIAEGGYESWRSHEDGLYARGTDDRIISKATALAERVGARRRDA